MTSEKMALAPHHWRTKNDVFAQPERSRLWLLLLENGIKLQSIILVLILQLLRSLMHIAYSYMYNIHYFKVIAVWAGGSILLEK